MRLEEWVGEMKRSIMPVKPNTVDEFLQIGCGRCKLGGTPQCKVHSWDEELRLLRSILRESGLTEEIKWSVPCYTHQGRNILLLSALKESVTVSFLRGAEMKDPAGLLEQPGENSRFARYMRFTDVEAVTSRRTAILEYIQEAIEIEQSGKTAEVGDDSLPEYPEELIQIFEENPDFEEAFSALTPGRQRGYLLYFSSAKQSQTRTARIEKNRAKIFAGKGWSDR